MGGGGRNTGCRRITWWTIHAGASRYFAYVIIVIFTPNKYVFIEQQIIEKDQQLMQMQHHIEQAQTGNFQYGAGQSSDLASTSSASSDYNKLSTEFRANNRTIIDRPEEIYRGWPLMLAYQRVNRAWRALISDYIDIQPNFLVANVQLHNHTLSPLNEFIKALFRRSPPGHYKVQTRLGVCLTRWDNEQDVPYLVYYTAGEKSKLHNHRVVYDNASLQNLLRDYSSINLHDHVLEIEKKLADTSNSRVFAVTNAEFFAYRVS